MVGRSGASGAVKNKKRMLADTTSVTQFQTGNARLWPNVMASGGFHISCAGFDPMTRKSMATSKLKRMLLDLFTE